MTVTTTAGDLSRTLRLAAAFAHDPDMGDPLLAAVYLEAAGGVLTATATDRYALGHARTGAVGDLPADGILVPVRWATWLADGLDQQPSQTEAVVDTAGVDGNRLRVATAATTATVPTVKPGLDGWVDYRRIFATIPDAPAGRGAPVLVNPWVLAVIADVSNILPAASARWTIVDPLKPIRCEVDNTLVALFMPAKDYPLAAECWPIPVGLPERELAAVAAKSI